MMAGSDDIAEGRAAALPGVLLRASAPSACIPWHAALLSSSQRIVALLLWPEVQLLVCFPTQHDQPSVAGWHG